MNLSEFPVTHKTLGMIYTPEKTTFRVWAPTQNKIVLAVYDSPKAPFRTLYSMEKASDGVFSAVVEGDLHGMFYTFIVDGLYEVTDPYSVTASANSMRSGIVDLNRTNPENWADHHRPKGNMGCDAILYEVHVKDFSGHPNSGMTNKGKFLAFTENDTKIENLTTGIDHLAELGVTHVHLMPVYDFLTVDEEIEQDSNYNWGYDPELFNSPEGSYSTDPNSAISRIKDLKAAIMALHEKGLKVVLDVVYNHTYRTEFSNFNTLVPHYYHRMTEDGHFSNGSGCGNEFASDQPMGRKFIIDSLLYWAKEYKVDGFRFDLMALIDKDTIEAAKAALVEIDPEIIIYGEPWMGGLSTLAENKRVYKGVQGGKGYSLFNDDFRDAIKGDNDGTGKGYIHGNKDMKHRMHTGIVGSIPYNANYVGFTTHPCESINYFNSHDNLILADKLRLTSPNISDEEWIKLNKMSFNLLFTAQGLPFIHAGNEFLRNKFGYHNTYNSPLSVNAIDWEYKVTYNDFYQYVRGLIQLRKTYSSLRLKTVEEIRQKLHFIEEGEFIEAFKDAIVYIIKQDPDADFDCLLVAHNPSHEPLMLSVNQLKGEILEFYVLDTPVEDTIITQSVLPHKAAAKHAKVMQPNNIKKIEIPNDQLKIELVFDSRGLLESPEYIDAVTHHLVKVAPQSSSIFRLGRKTK